jgi:3-dehydroquinate dehydratase type I
MEKVLEQEIAIGASVCKIVGTANKIEDNIAVLNFVASHSSKAKLVCFCMGEAGKISRLLSPMFGASFTYASIEQGNETAEGQISIGEMRAAYNILGV